MQSTMVSVRLFALARGIAETIPDSGVTVNSLIPGPTDSELAT